MNIRKLSRLLLLKILLTCIGTLPSLAQTDILPPILKTYRDGDAWYDFHEKRIFNLNKKFKLFHAQESALLEAWELNREISKSKIELEQNAIKIEKENREIVSKYNMLQEQYIKSENLFQDCAGKYNAQVEYNKLLEKSLRKQRITSITIGGLSLAGLVYLLIK